MSRSTDSRAAPAVLRRITRGKITAARAALRSRAPASIHEVRKRLKETRAILRLIRDEIGDRPFDLDNRRLRDAGRVLSAVRDAHVLIDTLATLLERERAKLNGESMEGVR